MTPDERLEAKHRKAVMAFMRAESKLVAAFNKYAKCRDQVRRYDKLADKQLAKRIGGDYDPRELVEKTGG
jgi:hypothetical protein